MISINTHARVHERLELFFSLNPIMFRFIRSPSMIISKQLSFFNKLIDVSTKQHYSLFWSTTYAWYKRCTYTERENFIGLTHFSSFWSVRNERPKLNAWKCINFSHKSAFILHKTQRVSQPTHFFSQCLVPVICDSQIVIFPCII